MSKRPIYPRHAFFFCDDGDPFDPKTNPYNVTSCDPPQLPPPDYEHPKDPSSVPIPLQHNIRYAFETGVKQEHLAMIYGYPLAWIRLFCIAPGEVPH